MKWWMWALLVGGGYWLWSKTQTPGATPLVTGAPGSCLGVQSASQPFLTQLLGYAQKLYGSSAVLDCASQAPNVGIKWGAGQYYAATWNEVSNFIINQASAAGVTL